ncbi:hypothetical protein GRAN_4991 [Granulicella sibirica]|uniref:Uncharacterized protein n=2 Tax=Granulicella sibirica TaxID=2479048 RepID=A0A4Q0SUM4_9BACT|nr:hypothetical protein GRAN_4991 [Granulicella sibirica]
MLRIAGSTASGASGTGGRDLKHYSTADALFVDLHAFGLGRDVVAAAALELKNPEVRKRFRKFADNVQIPFNLLEQDEIHLFD